MTDRSFRGDPFWAKVEELFAAQRWTELDALVTPRIASATSSAQLWKLLGTEPFANGLFGEDELGVELLRAVMTTAERFERPADRGGALSLVVRAAARDPLDLLVKNEPSVAGEACKRGPLTLLVSYEASWVRALADASPAVRAPAFLALCRLGAPAADTADAMLEAATKEKNAGALAAALLAASAMAARGRIPVTPLRVLALRHAGSAKPWVAVSAAAALALVGTPLTSPSLPLLLDSFRSPEPAPPALGLRWEEGVETSAGVAARVLVWAEVDDPAAVIKALAELGDYAEQAEEILMRFAFNGGATLPECGLAREELTQLQRLAVEALRAPAFARSFHFLHRFGLGVPADVDRFLQGNEPFFRPLRTLPRPFHLGRAWAEYCNQTLTAEQVLSAVREELSYDEAVSAFCVRRGFQLVRLNVPFSPEVAGQRANLPLAYAAGAGEPLRAALLRAAQKPAELDPTIFALMLLAAFEAELPAELSRLVQQGVRFANFKQPLTGLLEKLPDSRRTSVSWPANG